MILFFAFFDDEIAGKIGFFIGLGKIGHFFVANRNAALLDVALGFAVGRAKISLLITIQTAITGKVTSAMVSRLCRTVFINVFRSPRAANLESRENMMVVIGTINTPSTVATSE